MDSTQNSTNAVSTHQEKAKIVEFSQLNLLQREFLAHQAAGGLTIDENFKTGKMTVEELATKLGVTRDALYKAKSTIANWEELKLELREALWSERRVVKVWNGVFLRAAKGDYQQALLFLTNWSKKPVVIPTQKVEADVGDNLVELLNLAERRAAEHKIIDATPNTTQEETTT